MDRDSAERVKVDLKIGAGLLKVRGGTGRLMEADFTYNVPAWRPQVTYRSTGSLGTLTVEQPSGGSHIGNTHYEWDIALNEDVPMDLSAHFGAGEARLRIGELSLRSVELELGAGPDRSGPARNAQARLQRSISAAAWARPTCVCRMKPC